MPEYKESLVSQHLIFYWIVSMQSNKPPGSLDVIDFWVDATGPEEKSWAHDSRPKAGLVYILEDNSSILCGQCMSQKPAYPPMCANSGVPIMDRGLKLTGVHFSAQNVILDLGALWVQVNNI